MMPKPERKNPMPKPSDLAKDQQTQVDDLSAHLAAAATIMTTLWASIAEAAIIPAQREMAAIIKQRLKKAGHAVTIEHVPALRSTIVSFVRPKPKPVAWGAQPSRDRAMTFTTWYRCTPCAMNGWSDNCVWCGGGGTVDRDTKDRMDKTEDPNER